MMMSDRHQSTAAPTPSLGAYESRGTRAVGPVLVPSKEVVRKVDPALSFSLNGQDIESFDVILASDPSLFDPDQSHRRTPANFRSSKQDFAGDSIDRTTGFYMVPRAFLRDCLRQQPRPDRLYYVGVLNYGGTRPARMTVQHGEWNTAPFVRLAADIHVESLSKILGVAVERLGVLDGNGRVSRPMGQQDVTPQGRMIGGLPMMPHRPAPPMPPARQPAPQPAIQPGPAPVAQQPPIQHASAPVIPQPDPAATPPRQPDLDAAIPQTEPAAEGSDFVDDDVMFGATDDGAQPNPDFHDVDAASGAAQNTYDDGFGAMTLEDTASPIPPLDPAPEPLPNVAAPVPAHQPAPAATPAPAPTPTLTPTTPEPPLGDHDALVQSLMQPGGPGGRYDALNLDGAFKGRMGVDHPYYQRIHAGLAIGPHQASQDSGELGELLGLMKSADPASFGQIFGPDSEALLATTTMTGPSSAESPSGRSARVQPVAGVDLWDEPWAARFREAALHPPFQAAMRAQIIARRLEPMLPIATQLGIDDIQGQQMLLTLALHLGVGPAMMTLQSAINPVDSPAKVTTAIEALGHHDLHGFLTASRLPVGDVLTPEAHFTLFAALRELGDTSPVQIPDSEAIKDLIVTSVPPGATGDALLRLRVGDAPPDGA